MAPDGLLAAYGLASREVRLGVNELPGASTPEGFRIARFMVSKPFFRVFRRPGVVAARRFTLEDLDEKRHGGDCGGAGGIRTPDLLDAIEARCQLRHGPTDHTKQQCHVL